MYISSNIATNPITHFTPVSYKPDISNKAVIQPNASVIGAVILSDGVLVSPFASVRGDEGTPIFIGKNTNIQDGVIIHGLENKFVEKDGLGYSVHIGENVSLAHQSQVHGPAKIGDNTFVGMQAFVFKAEVGDNVVIEPCAKVMNVKVASGRYVPAGEVIKTQEQADKLPIITPDYAMKSLNHDVVEVNKALNKGYASSTATYPANYYMGKLN
jgi:carbonic anhydrase/acetyltransferase-like protein (isoleucine patch superfamily)